MRRHARIHLISTVALIVGLAGSVSRADAQPADSAPRPGTVFVYGGLLVTSIVNDKQDSSPGYLHYAFIGELDWPTTGMTIGGGAFVARHLSVGCELALRREMSTTISEQSYGHTDMQTLSSLYASQERLVSFPVRFHVRPGSRADIVPLGGMAISANTRTLTGRKGFYRSPPFPPVPIANPDVSVSATQFGLFGGADVAVRLGHGLAVVAAPRLHWIHREQVDSYTHAVPYAGHLIFSVMTGLQWQSGTGR